jgi:hypothetical protein
MSKLFYQFTQSKFKTEMKRIIYPEKLIDITDRLQKSGNHTWERTYEITTRHKKVFILVYSSIDIRTDSARENGNDRVRVVMRWETKFGNRYRHLDRHNRINTLFINLENTIKKAKTEVFYCNKFNWTPILEEAL